MKNEVLEKLINKDNLIQEEVEKFFETSLEKSSPDSLISAFITALTMKGAQTDEMCALAFAMRKRALRLDFCECNVVDSCGTGADLQGTFNISTAAAITAAACGARVVKQTNSGITSRCGSSDFIEALGIKLCTEYDQAQYQFEKNNICFVHSPSFNAVAKRFNPIRQELGFKSVFNFLGPIINPSFPDFQLLGVSDPLMAQKIVQVLKFLKTKHAMVVNAQNPLLDEISICSETTVHELYEGEIRSYIIKPEDFGIKRVDISYLRGATPQYNANLIKEIFEGKLKGAKTDIIALNAGAMLYLSGLAKNLLDGAMKAYAAIDSKKALEKLTELQNTRQKS